MAVACAAPLSDNSPCGVDAVGRCQRCESPRCASHGLSVVNGAEVCEACRTTVAEADPCHVLDDGRACGNVATFTCSVCKQRACSAHEAQESYHAGVGRVGPEVVTELRWAGVGRCSTCERERLTQEERSQQRHSVWHTKAFFEGPAQELLTASQVPVVDLVEIVSREAHPYPRPRRFMRPSYAEPRRLGTTQTRVVGRAWDLGEQLFDEGAIDMPNKRPGRLLLPVGYAQEHDPVVTSAVSKASFSRGHDGAAPVVRGRTVLLGEASLASRERTLDELAPDGGFFVTPAYKVQASLRDIIALVLMLTGAPAESECASCGYEGPPGR